MGALQDHFGPGGEADEPAIRLQAVDILVAPQNAAAGGDDHPVLRGGFGDHGALLLAEPRLTRTRKDLRDAAPGALLDDGIRIEERPAERPRQMRPNGTLARSHETY